MKRGMGDIDVMEALVKIDQGLNFVDRHWVIR